MMAFDDYHTWSPASISTTTTTKKKAEQEGEHVLSKPGSE